MADLHSFKSANFLLPLIHEPSSRGGVLLLAGDTQVTILFVAADHQHVSFLSTQS
jgi:hypothetical protein